MFFRLIASLLLFISIPLYSWSAEPVLTDSRIKTYVYNESEVFRITAHFGYHTYIEFAKDEVPEYIQFGDKMSWGYDVVANKLFLKVIDGHSHTNMTVISNLGRTYQFDLKSKLPPKEIDSNLTYVVKFFYPDNNFDSLDIADSKAVSDLPLPSDKDFNFDYTMVGPDSIAPIAVFDDGRETYFKFDQSLTKIPSISMLEPSGLEMPLKYRKEGGFIIVNRVVNQYTIRLGRELICLFNEQAYKSYNNVNNIGGVGRNVR